MDYSNMYVIDGKLGVFTNYDGSTVYTGTVYGKNNEILMTVKDGDSFYSYWAASVTDPSATMATYRVADYKKDLATLEENDNKLYRNDIKKVTMSTDTNTATFNLLRNGDTDAGILVEGGAITITSGGGTGGSGVANDTWVRVANGEGTNQTFATGTKVEAIGSEAALTGVKINGTDYAINNKTYIAGTNVQISDDNVISATDTKYTAGNNVTIDADNKIHATDTKYTAGANVQINDDNVISATDTDTTYSAGSNVTIDADNKIHAVDTTYTAGTGIKIEGENNAISVDPTNVNLSYRANNAATSNSVSLSQGLNFVQDGSVTVTTGENGLVTISGQNNYVTQGTYDAENKKLQLTRDGVEGTVDIDLSAIKGGGWKLQTTGEAVTVEPESTVKFEGVNSNINVTNNGATVKVGLNSALTGITSVSNGNAVVALNDGNVVVNSKVSFGQDGKISNVAAGTAATDAVNVSQLNAAKTVVVAGNSNVTVTPSSETPDGHTIYTIETKDTTYTAGTNVQISDDNVISATDTDTTYSAGSNVTIDADNKIHAVDTTYTAGTGIKIEGENNAISVDPTNVNLSYRANNAATSNSVSLSQGLNFVQDGSVTVTTGENGLVTISGQNNYVTQGTYDAENKKLQLTRDGVEGTVDIDLSAIKGGGWKLQTTGEAVTVEPESTVKFEGVNSNINVTNNGATVKVGLNSALTGITSVSNGNAVVALNDGNVVVNSKVSFGQDGKISNVAAGTAATDAVNVSQLNAAKTVVVAGNSNVTVTPSSETPDGHTIYTIETKDTTYTAGNNVAISEDNVISAVDTTYTAGNGIAITGAANAISVKLKTDETNLAVDQNGLSLNKALEVDSVDAGGTVINSSGLSIGNNTYVSSSGLNANSQKITDVLAGEDDTDAVNVAQLRDVEVEAGKHTTLADGKNTTVEPVATSDGHLEYKVNLNAALEDITSISNGGKQIDMTGNQILLRNGDATLAVAKGASGMQNGTGASVVLMGQQTVINSHVVVDSTGKISGVADGEINATSTDAINGSQLHATNERVSKVEGDITSINTEITSIKGDINAINTRIDGIDAEITEINTKVETNTQNIATNTENISKLDVRVTNVEELAKKHTTVEEGSNITVTEGENDDGGKKYTVALKDEISLAKVTTGGTVMNNDGLKVGANVSVTKDAVTAGSTSISDDGLKIGDKTYVSSDGLNANSQKITNVAAGEADTDAVNVSQLNATNEQIINNSNRISKLGDRVNKVGAGAAALAALHPMDFDPDDKWSFAAGYGNYAGQNAAAIGAYYRPDEKVMFSVGGTVGNGENMVNAGISFALDRTNRVSNSRTAMAREIVDLRGQLTQVTAELASLKATLGVIDETKTKLFPDVPANHWAYEYISKLAGNGYIEGYPDGNFDGNRLMTRYEFAAMLYRAMEKGAALEERIINEFAPELGRIRVDRISGKDGDRDKIERVRVNGPKNERDHYGSKLK
ncbi:MAG: YadA-like family protein [Phoenicibacter congonensis]|uniref:YadA-like family protein n=1 Tax=Phoenicibacter congonensis TaxID=1944646 RepID=A0AA43RHH0_9ACTN|nr:YadA-like family protein [Phoenicibacter congonensis]